MTFEVLLHLHLYNISIHLFIFKISEKSQFLFTKFKSDLEWPLQLNFILWNFFVFIVLAFMPNFDKIRFKQMIYRRNIKWKYDLMFPSITSEVIHHKIKNLCLYNITIHINFHRNQFINECARNDGMLELRNYGVYVD